MFGFNEKINGENGCAYHNAGMTEGKVHRTEHKTEHYDGASLLEVFGDAYRPQGNKAHFIDTRVYLQQVRDGKRRVELLESRIQYRKDAGMDANDLELELADVQEKLKTMTVEVAEEISKLCDVSQEMVMVKRYIDALSWSEIAETLDIKMRTVQKFHGRALPRMQSILLEDGLVELAVEDESDGEEHTAGEEESVGEDEPVVGEESAEEDTDEYFND